MPRPVRLHDLAELLRVKPGELERDLQRKGARLRSYFGKPAVQWPELSRHLDPKVLGKLERSIQRRGFDKERSTWTVASFPDLLALWDTQRNRRFKPRRVTYRSQQLVWWKCRIDAEHRWDEAPASRLQQLDNGRYRTLGCPFCSGHRTVASHSLASEHPSIARQWHPDLNSELRPREVSPKSAKIVWWRCAKKHEWQSKISNRTLLGRGCPYCAGQALVPARSLAAIAPDLAAQWHPTKNGKLTPLDVAARSTRKVWWKCPAAPDHEWRNSPDSRAQARGCPFCSNHRVSKSNCLGMERPDLAREWHPTRNRALTPEDITPGSNRKVWWKCAKGPDHEWSCSIANRSRLGSGCPFCSGRCASRTNNLARLYPRVAKQWHPRKNGKLSPTGVTPKSGRLIWWQCPKGEDHVWRCTVASRTRLASGCPFCAGVKVSKTNSLAGLYPQIAKQWHPRRNGKLKPAAVMATSKSAAWWRCALGHDWFMSVHARTVLRRGCPICAESEVIGRLARSR